MLKQPIYVEFNLDAKVNNSKLIAISHVDDKYSETLEVAVKQNDRFVYMGGANVVARMVLHREKDYLLSDSVPCTVNANGNILIPFDNAVVKTLRGTVKIEVNITRDTDELTLQFPLWVSVNGSILDNAEVTPESEGTIPDLLEDASDALEAATEALENLGDYDNLDNKPQIDGVTLSGNQTPVELGLQKALTAGTNVTIDENGVISATGGVTDYNNLTNKPVIEIYQSGLVKYYSWEGTIPFSLADFKNPYAVSAEKLGISLSDNVFRNFLDHNYAHYDFDYLWSEKVGTGCWYISKENAINLPNEFEDAADIINIFNFATPNPVSSNHIRVVTYLNTSNKIRTFIQFFKLTAPLPAVQNKRQVYDTTTWQEIGGSEIVSGVVNQNGTITFTDSDGNTFTTSGASVIGPQGAPGNDYVLTPQDKEDIADIVLQELPTTQGVLYGNANN